MLTFEPAFATHEPIKTGIDGPYEAANFPMPTSDFPDQKQIKGNLTAFGSKLPRSVDLSDLLSTLPSCGVYEAMSVCIP